MAVPSPLDERNVHAIGFELTHKRTAGSGARRVDFIHGCSAFATCASVNRGFDLRFTVAGRHPFIFAMGARMPFPDDG